MGLPRARKPDYDRVVRAWLAVGSLALTVLLAGCGGSSHSTAGTGYAPQPNGERSKFPDQIITDAIAAADSAKSVHISGSVINSGKPLKLDLDLVTGKGGAGTVTLNGLTFQIVRIGSKAYFKADATFWRHFGGAALGAALSGRWIEASATSGDLASLTPITDVEQLFQSVLGSHGPLEKAANTVAIGGQPTIGIIDSGQGATVFIAADGEPYPLKLLQSGGGSVVFERWNAEPALTAPAGALDFDKLKKG